MEQDRGREQCREADKQAGERADKQAGERASKRASGRVISLDLLAGRRIAECIGAQGKQGLVAVVATGKD